jgi:hypothetical protein
VLPLPLSSSLPSPSSPSSLASLPSPSSPLQSSYFRTKGAVSRKERQRISMISMRRFFGDYLCLMSWALVVCASSSLPSPSFPSSLLFSLRSSFTSSRANLLLASEQCIFSCKCQAIVHPTLRANKLSPRFLVLTQQALYLIKLKKVCNEGEGKM